MTPCTATSLVVLFAGAAGAMAATSIVLSLRRLGAGLAHRTHAGGALVAFLGLMLIGLNWSMGARAPVPIDAAGCPGGAEPIASPTAAWLILCAAGVLVVRSFQLGHAAHRPAATRPPGGRGPEYLRGVFRALVLGALLLSGVPGCAADNLVKALEAAGNDHASVRITTDVSLKGFTQTIERTNPYPTTAPAK